MRISVLRPFPRAVLGLKLFIFAAAALWPTASCRFYPDDTAADRSSTTHTPTAETAESVHLVFGNPSQARPDPSERDNYLLVGRTSVMSYNNSRGTANWVAWRTTAADLGERLPRGDFEPDRRLPSGFTRIVTYDYSGSGYDRGHLVPSADRFGDINENRETFLMTNIVPQTGELNQYPWNKLENYARNLVRRGRDIYTIAGVYGDKGRIRNKVTIPAGCWKIIVVLPRNADPRSIGPRTRVIAVDMPNETGLRTAKWESFRTTVRAIEQKTGLDLFDQLPRDVQDAIEVRVDD